LNYTPVTATAAITLDYVPNGSTNPPSNHGLRDITLVNNQSVGSGGSGSLAVGIQIGNTNSGANDAVMDNVSVYGFGIGYANTNALGVNVNWVNPSFLGNTLALSYGNVTEKFVNGIFAGNGQIVQSVATAAPEIYMTNVNTFVNAATTNGAFDFTRSSSTNPSFLNLTNCHLENSTTGAAHHISGNVKLMIVGGIMEDDNAVGTGDWMVNVSGNSLVQVFGLMIQSSRAYTNVFLFNAGTRGVIEASVASPGTLFPATLVGGANVGNVTTMIEPVTSATAAYPWVFESPLKFPTATLTQGQPTVAAAQVGLGVNTAASATAGSNGDVPLQVVGYWIVNIGGTNQKIPYYNV
jgi:hypothetical protein